MEVMNLATKEKQDEILGNFPISGGTDWFDSVFNTADISTPIHLEWKVIEVTGKGIVTFLKCSGANTLFTVEIDGIRRGINGPTNAILPVFMPFNTHIKVTSSEQVGNGVNIGYCLF